MLFLGFMLMIISSSVKFGWFCAPFSRWIMQFLNVCTPIFERPNLSKKPGSLMGRPVLLSIGQDVEYGGSG